MITLFLKYGTMAISNYEGELLGLNIRKDVVFQFAGMHGKTAKEVQRQINNEKQFQQSKLKN